MNTINIKNKKLIDQILCFSHMFYKLKDGGYYIVEDLNFPEIHEKYNITTNFINRDTAFN